MKRYESLDSLRGLAALAVMIGHFLLVFPFMAKNTTAWGYLHYPINLLKYTPLHIFWAGHEAVILFFLLSGFVLSLPFLHGRNTPYRFYVVKRICRIYIPYLVAVFAAIAAKSMFFRERYSELSPYFNVLWTAQTDGRSIWQHVLFVENFNSTYYDPILWSLVHEMRISLIFPLVMLLVVKMEWKIMLPAAFLLSYLGQYFYNKYHPPFMTNYQVTLHYLAFFILGALLAKYREPIKEYILRIGRGFRLLLLLAGFLLYTFHWFLFEASFHKAFTAYQNDWFIAAGGCIYMVFAFSSPTIAKGLSWTPVRFLGKVSYSLYLYHFVVLLSFLHLLRGHIPLAGILVLAFFCSFVAAAVGYYAVELPSMKLGKWLTRGIESRSFHVSSTESSANKL